MASRGLDGAIAGLERRYGPRAVLRACVAEERAAERRIATGTSLDRVTGGLAVGASIAFVGEGTCGKVSLALRAVAGAQREGGSVLWVDPAASFDARAAERAGVALDRLLVVRARTPDDALRAVAAGLRGDGSRIVVADCGPELVPGLAPVDLLPVLPLVRGSTAALLVLCERLPARVALPAVAFAHVAWERHAERTLGYVVAASPGGFSGGEAPRYAALFGLGALDARFRDAGIASTLAMERAS